ncbi:MAG: PKD domain-containing protein [Prevotellaceae bacterium]|nr:PKD domain-containing protein [Prevotellaceae bacterium]
MPSEERDMIETVSQDENGVLYDNMVNKNIILESPNGSKHIVRLGNYYWQTFSERLSYTFTVTDSTKYILYHYAMVLEDPEHRGRNFFYAEIEDHECSKTFYFGEDTVFTDLKTYGSYFYKDWSANLIDLSSDEFMNKEVTLTFITSDCAQGGHGGYAYFDAMFVNSAIEIKNEQCKGNVLDISCSATGLFRDETWEWDFGDGTFSTDKEPKHTYKQEGEYTISLKITNPDVEVGCQERIIKNTIVISDSCTPVTPCTPNTLIYREDFGGNSMFDPVVAPSSSISDHVSELTYNSWPDGLMPIIHPVIFVQNVLEPFALRENQYALVMRGKYRYNLWNQPVDHTYPGIRRGYMMQVNGSSPTATCYRFTLEDLCPGSSLRFSGWGMSLMQANAKNADAQLKLIVRRPGNPEPVAEKEIILKNGKNAWEQFDLECNVPAGAAELTFEIITGNKNAIRFNGNDFVLDDIEVHTCTPKVDLDYASWVCLRDTLKIRYKPGGEFKDPSYRWLRSADGNINGHWTEVGDYPDLLIANATAGDAGYYRLEITDGNSSCPAKSDPVRISVRDCDICVECVASFAPVPGEKYVLSAWVRETGHKSPDNEEVTVTAYENSVIALSFENSNEEFGAMAEGAIIDGWQRIYTEFTVPAEAAKMHLDLVNTGMGESYFDDIRVFPFNGNMKSYVYDPVTMRLVAELDNENYATFYEYDEEGALIRVKKETERGIMTIREARQGQQKKDE